MRKVSVLAEDVNVMPQVQKTIYNALIDFQVVYIEKETFTISIIHRDII